MTMNESWGFTADDDRWKSAPTIISHLVDTVSAGGNLLLNVGPDGAGRFPAEAQDRLQALGHWVRAHREAVFNVEPESTGIVSPVPVAVKRVSNGATLYVYCTMRPWDRLTLGSVPVTRVESVRVLATGESLTYDAIARLADVHAGVSDPLGNLEVSIPQHVADAVVPVLEVRLAAPREEF